MEANEQSGFYERFVCAQLVSMNDKDEMITSVKNQYVVEDSEYEQQFKLLILLLSNADGINLSSFISILGLHFLISSDPDQTLLPCKPLLTMMAMTKTMQKRSFLHLKTVHSFEVGKWVDDVSCRMSAGEMAHWFECSLSQKSQWLSYTQRI
ncbi:hypothetical protein HELRODRAFT_174418 [Helobdella robusta]|uniref:Uncharacterized protein n=1 Tax=Helobdella robusta TaxID=6412 RepID=T1F838_HELRO|nr:hypothetical protein HELRODRAFT_174418 [Helobdella robusta]ESO02941.1 hypothetical protein HELRODRAFT_174418 [Helobdella robusta]